MNFDTDLLKDRGGEGEGGGFSMETSNLKEFTSDFLTKIHDEIAVIVPRIFFFPDWATCTTTLFYPSIHPSIRILDIVISIVNRCWPT